MLAAEEFGRYSSYCRDKTGESEVLEDADIDCGFAEMTSSKSLLTRTMAIPLTCVLKVQNRV